MRCDNCQMPRRSAATYCTYCGKPHLVPSRRISSINPHQIGNPIVGDFLVSFVNFIKGPIFPFLFVPFWCLFTYFFGVISWHVLTFFEQ